MEVKQIYTLVNNATQEILGEENLLKEDLSNVVDIGQSSLQRRRSLCPYGRVEIRLNSGKDTG